jgi:mannosyltransferase OCH1-like enzyme
MRRGTKIFIFLNLVSITLLVHTFSTLIALLFETGLDDAIPASEIQISDDYFRDLTKEQEVERGLVVPRILHQTYKTREVPEKWVESQRSCLEEIGWSVEEARTGVRGSRNATAEGMMEDWDYMVS